MSGQEPIERPWDKPKDPKQSSGAWWKSKFVVGAVGVGGLLIAGGAFLEFGGGDSSPPSSSAGSSSTESSSTGSSSSSMSLSEAFCSDLKSGMTPMNILGEAVSEGRYSPQQAADRAYGFAAISCPEQLQTNELLRTYLQNWNINPDA